MKNDDLLKKGQNLAEDVLNKGKELLKDAKNKADDLGLTDKAKDAKDAITEKAKDFDPNEVKDSMRDLFNKVTDNFKDAKKEGKNKFEDKKEELIDNAKDVKDRLIDKGEELKPSNSNFGKKAASVALASAAAAGAYTIYKNKKAQEENIRSEFSEKMKKWNELSDEEIKAEKENPLNFLKVKSSQIYKLGENAKLDDLVINISDASEEVSFNPETIAEPLHQTLDIKEKATDIAKVLSDKLKNLSKSFSEAAQNSKDKADELIKEAKEKGKEAKDKLESKVEDAKDEAIEVKEDLKDKTSKVADELEYKVENVRGDLKEDIENAKETMEEKFEENKLASSNENEKVDNIVEKDKEEDSEDSNDKKAEEKEEDNKKVYNPAGRNEKIEGLYAGNDEHKEIKWEDEQNDLNEKADEIKNAAIKGFSSLKETLASLKETIVKNLENVSKEAKEGYKEVMSDTTSDLEKKELSALKEAEDEEMIIEEYNVVIHNKGEKDYYFSPTLIQRYNTKTRRTVPTPAHEEGTSLESRVIKPGETYKGKIAINKGVNDDAIIFFKDLSMNESITILLKGEMDEDFVEKEKEDLVDQLLFEDDKEDETDETLDELNKNAKVETDLEPSKKEVVEVAKDEESATK